MRDQFATDAPLDYKPIWDMKPALRRAEVERQLAAAVLESDIDDPETGAVLIELTWAKSRFDKARTDRYVSHGITDPLDLNSKEQLLLSQPDDPDVKWLTVALHMVARIAPVKEG